ncbi:anti-sigma factor family protein [Streptomyces anulatus]|uniref:anti-sigma factor family protein n=1 Tax=Streptomyces anulatus TaxID=1892 RepID=UPI00255D012F|nr:zf-HC2 domain-containing protein [Streptomyces anulatus]WIY77337.1 zf-HC2 domain-containing protein [Streptomyces anulatus]
MTSTADTAQHPEVSEISDLTEGLLSPSRAAEVRQHVAGCDLCSKVRDSLEEIRDLLGTMPTPEPMPEDIAARIDAALAAEVRPTAPVVDEPVVVSRETTTVEDTTTDRATSESASRSIGAPAPSRPAGRSSAATGPGRRPARRRRRAVVLGTAFGAAVIGMSVFFLQSIAPSGDSSKTAADSGVSAAESSAHAYADGTLESQVQDLLGGGASQESPGAKKVPPGADTKSSSEAVTPDTEGSRSPLKAPAVVVPPCVQQATGRTTPALALDEGTYQGTDAYLVVLPHPGDPSRVQAYVVAASCVDTAPESIGQLLLTRSYDRP